MWALWVQTNKQHNHLSLELDNIYVRILQLNPLIKKKKKIKVCYLLEPPPNEKTTLKWIGTTAKPPDQRTVQGLYNSWNPWAKDDQHWVCALAVLFTWSLIHRHTADDGLQKIVKITLGQLVVTNLQLLWLKFSLCDIRRPAKEELGSLWKTHIEALRRRQKLQQGGGSRRRGEHSARHRVWSRSCQTHSTLLSVLSPCPVPMPQQSNAVRNAPTLPSHTWKTNNASNWWASAVIPLPDLHVCRCGW